MTSKKDLVSELNEAWAYTTILKATLKKIEAFTENEYLKYVESPTDFRGGYAAAIKDLKSLLNE